VKESIEESAARLVSDRLGREAVSRAVAACARVRLLRGYDAHAASRASALDCGEECIVQQHHRDEVDVNTIVRRFGLTGALPTSSRAPFYGDFTGITDYESALDAIERAEAGFMALPAELREEYGNDPARFLAEAGNLKEEGLDALDARLRAPEEPPAVDSPVVPPSEGAAAS